MSEIIIRTNGRGNAWPVFPGFRHHFYDHTNFYDLTNASYSILRRNILTGAIENEILIDAGHGIVQFNLSNQNRMPDAIVITHPHIDHTLSLDWFAQANYRVKGTLLKVYASKLCIRQVFTNFPQLEKLVEFEELLPGNPVQPKEFPGIEIVFFPVFHGESAHGSGMILIGFKSGNKQKKVLFTGDLLCPLLRNMDIEFLKACQLIFVDSNNRFPYPKTNHWSISGFTRNATEDYFSQWLNDKGRYISWLVTTSLTPEPNTISGNYFDCFLEEQLAGRKLFFDVFSFVRELQPEQVNLIHYSGREDRLYNNSPGLNSHELKCWANSEAVKLKLNTKFHVPLVGEEFKP
ncbi:MAG: MBL fold metallo-hydrolase [Bacteroidales bacterium]